MTTRSWPVAAGCGTTAESTGTCTRRSASTCASTSCRPRRAALAAFLKERGIQTGIHYPVPTHRQPAIERFAPSPLARTERLVEEILTLPMSADHEDAEIDRVIAAVREFFEA